MPFKPRTGESPEERRDKLADAAAMVRGGRSVSSASRIAAVPRSTLRSWLARLEADDDGSREQKLRAAEDEILDISIVIAQAAGAELARRATQEPDKLTLKELQLAYGTAVDKTNLRRGWGKGAAGDGAGVGSLAGKLAELGAGERLTLTVERSAADPVADAVDVTP